MTNTKRIAAGLSGVLALTACASLTGPAGCRTAGAVPLDGGSCLVWDAGEPLQAYRSAIGAEVERTLVAVRATMPVDPVEIRVRSGVADAIPEIGLGGRAVEGELVVLTFNPAFSGIDSTVGVELFRLLAHELHHIARQKTVGYGSDLLGAVVSEGLADQFTVELAGGEPPVWAKAVGADDLARLLDQAAAQWYGPYDHQAWFFGDGAGIPRWTGYTLGWHVVGRYLDAHPSERASALFSEPAQTFVPTVSGR